MPISRREASESVSVVVPVFDEGAGIAEVIGDLAMILDARPRSELIVVDDGSTDETPDVLRDIASTDPRVSVVRSERNRGHGPSLRTGLDHAKGRWLFLTDADGQIAGSQFEALWTARASADLVIGSRIGRTERRYRRALSRVVRILASRAGGVELDDPNVPFKLVRREVWEDLRRFMPEEPVTPSLLIPVGAALRGWRINTVSVKHQPRPHRRSKLGIARLARLSARAAVELFSFRRRALRGPPRREQQPGLPTASTK